MKNLFKKIAITFTLIMALSLSFAFAGCGDKPEDKPCNNHTWEFVSDTATCVDDGIATYRCSICGNEKEETSKATLTHNFVNGKCKFCNSPTQPIDIIEIKCERSSSQYVRISGKAKNVSPLRIRNIKFTYYLISIENNEQIVVGQDYNFLVSNQFMEVNSILEFDELIKCTYTTEFSQYILNIQAPTFSNYNLKYNIT